MTMNSDGNIVGRLGAVAVIVAALWGVHKVNCSTGYCPTMKQASASCCPTEGAAAPATPAPDATPAKH
jgi:hypothetical protein